MRRILPAAFIATLVSGCVQPPLAEYRPVVDPAKSNVAKYEKDRQACLAIAEKIEADYNDRQAKEVGANMLAGMLLGAVVGAAVGDSSTAAAGAGAGAVAGAASGDYDHDLVTYGPRRVVDRCMTDRGHTILADPGKS